ncbi:MAG: CRISPR-associated endonuclease Cas1 [Azonexus sp.]|jgi:CRISPR-associated protein Cas1|uniref:CRISPR-associated endonuclease Cas1 n=1 Tax=Azonexus sp. TaxID=1872668 RepID=UPI002832FD1D|nr:CRISPR-associated endonuclease Cas1 [Azonexus sp.]MDR0776275.1 CRISPR-associated endonuclease Cas1 [Azonexus sp.]
MTSLFVDRRSIELELDSDAIVFRENQQRVGTVPVAPLTRVFLRGDVRLSAALLGRLGERDVGVVILSGRRGKASLMLARPHNDASRRVEQIRKSFDPEYCLGIARQLIDRKLQRQIEWFAALREKDMQARYELSLAMRHLAEARNKLSRANNLTSLRGLEGAAAARYFEGLRAVLPPSLGFKNRNRRPPKDPFNALLSLTYTLAHAELVIALHGAGFDPCVGFYHQLAFARESLASDLLEPLRPLCDQFCFEMAHKRIISADDFSTTPSGCLLGKAGRARYYSAYEEKSEALRGGIHVEIQALAEQIGHAIPAPPLETGPEQDNDGDQ